MNELLLSELESDKKELLPAIALIEKVIFSTQSDLTALAPIIDDCRLAIAEHKGALEQVERFINELYVEQLFIDNPRDFWSSLSFFIEPAILHREMSPMLKAIIIRHIAMACGFETDIVFVPKKAMVRIICDDVFAIIFDPVTGESLNGFELDEKLEEIDNDPNRQQLDVMSNKDVIAQYLSLLKTTLIRELNHDCALKCVDILLALKPDDPQERRDRGFLLQQLDCFKVAYDDYRFFIDQCPQDPMAQLLKIQLENINVTDTVFH